MSKKNERPPVITVLGHVDHGKTTLLDSLRKTAVAEAEEGGITQHIGAYQIEHKKNKLTFIDTPGHEAFAKMRLHGAQAADIAILVIAADDGVQPQTVEALNHIKAAEIPYLIAINKIDLPGASESKIKNQLNQEGVFLEEYGGDIVAVNISAKKKKNLDELLEMIVLLTEMQELKADKKGKLEASVVESFLHAKRGVITSLVVKNGTLKRKDKLYAVEKNGGVLAQGKIKAMFNDKREKINKAEPGDPVEILGVNKVVPLGTMIFKKGEEDYIKKRMKDIKELEQVKKAEAEEEKKTKAEDETKEVEEKKEKKANEIKIVLKADTFGTLQAVKDSLPYGVEIINSGVGEISESDILLASSTGSVLIAFGVEPSKSIKKLAQMEGVIIRNYTIIYELIKDLQDVTALEEETEEIVGKGKIIAEFEIKGKHIAGTRLTQGIINRKNWVKVVREKRLIGERQIESLEQEGTIINQAEAVTEVGIVFKKDLDFEVGDAIIPYNKKLED